MITHQRMFTNFMLHYSTDQVEARPIIDFIISMLSSRSSRHLKTNLPYYCYTTNPNPLMHSLCFSTISLHIFLLSESSSMLLPYVRKQSSLSFFVSGHAQHLKQKGVRSFIKLKRFDYVAVSTHGLTPCGFLSDMRDFVFTEAFTTGSSEFAGVRAELERELLRDISLEEDGENHEETHDDMSGVCAG